MHLRGSGTRAGLGVSGRRFRQRRGDSHEGPESTEATQEPAGEWRKAGARILFNLGSWSQWPFSGHSSTFLFLFSLRPLLRQDTLSGRTACVLCCVHHCAWRSQSTFTAQTWCLLGRARHSPARPAAGESTACSQTRYDRKRDRPEDFRRGADGQLVSGKSGPVARGPSRLQRQERMSQEMGPRDQKSGFLCQIAQF